MRLWTGSTTVDLTNLTNTGPMSTEVREWQQGATTLAAARLTLRVDLGEDRAIGPGKIRLLEAIRDTGSITKAGIALGMSYRRAWLLVDDMNNWLSRACRRRASWGNPRLAAPL